MINSASFALAASLGLVFLAPVPAMAIDNGPCDHCTMEPIVVIGDRDKKKPGSRTLRTNNYSSAVHLVAE